MKVISRIDTHKLQDVNYAPQFKVARMVPTLYIRSTNTVGRCLLPPFSIDGQPIWRMFVHSTTTSCHHVIPVFRHSKVEASTKVEVASARVEADEVEAGGGRWRRWRQVDPFSCIHIPIVPETSERLHSRLEQTDSRQDEYSHTWIRILV